MRYATGGWWRKLSLLGFAAVGCAVLVLGSAVLAPNSNERCQKWKDRYIGYAHMTPTMLRALRTGTPVHETPALLSMSPVPMRLGGFALPERIFVSARLATEYSLADREYVIWHELVHVEQMRRDGDLRFALVYATDWVRGRWNGCGSFAAYEAIRYEREADLYATAMSTLDWKINSSLNAQEVSHSTQGGLPEQSVIAEETVENAEFLYIVHNLLEADL